MKGLFLKSQILCGLLMAFFCGRSFGAEPAECSTLKVATLELKENAVIYVPTHPNVTVFLQFPDTISDYTGRGFSENPNEVAGDFFVRHLDGDSYMSITPLTEMSRRTLHVVCGGKGYPFHLFPAPEDAAWDKVILLNGDAGDVPREKTKAHSVSRRGVQEKAHAVGVERSAKAPSSKSKSLSTERALGMVDTLRLLANLPERKARAVVASNSALSFSPKQKRQECGDFALTTHFVLRDNVYDALGFAITIENATNDCLVFLPTSLMVRAGDHVYAPSTVDMDPMLKPHATASVFFVLAGDGTGEANHLAAANDFRISIDSPTRDNVSRVLTEAIPIPAKNGGSGEE